MVSAKEKSRNSTNPLRIKKGLKKKAFEFLTLVDVDACMIIYDPKQDVQGTDYCPVEPELYPDNSQEVHRIIQCYRECNTTHECRGVSTIGGVDGSMKKRNNRDLIQKPAEIVTSSSSEQDDALLKGGFLFNFEIEEELKNEFMGFDEQNVKINQMRITEEENLLDSSCTVAASTSSEFLVEGDNCIWPSDELDQILNAFDDNADHHQENMFDLLPLSPPPITLTNAFIDNRFHSTSDNWPTYTMVEWDQIFS